MLFDRYVQHVLRHGKPPPGVAHPRREFRAILIGSAEGQVGPVEGYPLKQPSPADIASRLEQTKGDL